MTWVGAEQGRETSCGGQSDYLSESMAVVVQNWELSSKFSMLVMRAKAAIAPSSANDTMCKLRLGLRALPSDSHSDWSSTVKVVRPDR